MAEDYPAVGTPDEEELRRKAVPFSPWDMPPVMPPPQAAPIDIPPVGERPNFRTAMENTIGAQPKWSDYAPVQSKGFLPKLGHVLAGMTVPTNEIFNKLPEQRAEKSFTADTNAYTERARQAEKEAELQQKPEIAELQGEMRGTLQAQRDADAMERTGKLIEGRHEDVKTTQEGATKRAQGKQEFDQKKLDEDWQKYLKGDEFRKWKEKLDTDTKLRVAQMTQGKAPAAIQQTAEFAGSGLNRLAEAQDAMAQLKASGAMGSLPANKVEDWIFGKGLVDPTLDANTRHLIGKMRAALSYTSTAAMRAHTGRTSKEIYDDMKSTLGPGQDWNALDGAMEETSNMLGEYSQAASSTNMENLREGKPIEKAAPAGNRPTKENKGTWNAKTGRYE